MCTAIQEMKEESRAQGQAQLIQQAVKSGSSIEQIARVLALPVEEVKKLSKG